jgi:O-antigen ligase
LNALGTRTRSQTEFHKATVRHRVAAIAALDLLIYCIGRLGLPVPEEILTYRLEGFEQKPNAFALQLVLTLIAAFISINAARLQTIVMGILFIGFWSSGSRSGFIAVGLVLVPALALRAVKPRRLCAALLILLLTALIVDNLPEIVTTMVTALHTGARLVASLFGSTLPEGQIVLHLPKYSTLEAIVAGYGSSNVQRIASLKGGWAMFTSHPIFGAGLGAFMESYTRTNGVPLVIHSTLLWFLAEMGVIGLLVLVAPFVRVFKNEVHAADRGDPARIFLILALLGFGAFAVVHDIGYQRSFWMLFGAALSCGARSPDIRSSAFGLADRYGRNAYRLCRTAAGGSVVSYKGFGPDHRHEKVAF